MTLTGAVVVAHHPSRASLALYLRLADGSGSAAEDSSGNNRPGTLHQNVRWAAGLPVERVAVADVPRAVQMDVQLASWRTRRFPRQTQTLDALHQYVQSPLATRKRSALLRLS